MRNAPMTGHPKGTQAASSEPRLQAPPAVADRYRGCLLGGAVGDALGAPVEFMTRAEIVRRFGDAGIRELVPAYGRLGAITDDTQMTLFCAEGMLRGVVRAMQRGIGPAFASVTAHAYLRWLFTQGTRHPLLEEPESGWLIGNRELFSRRAPGTTCLAALRAMKGFGEPAENDSKGCGAVMRVAPIGLLFAQRSDTGQEFDGEVFRAGVEDAALTHGHPSGQLPAGFFALVTALLVRGGSLAQAIEQARSELRQHDRHQETLAAVDSAVELARTHPDGPQAIAELGEGWVAEEALAISLYCALTARDFESGVIRAVNHSGDSDSTGAISGNLLGAMLGLPAIPERWLKPLELKSAITAMADDLATVLQWPISSKGDFDEERSYTERYPGW